MHGWSGFATLLVGLGVAGYAFHPGGSGLDPEALLGRSKAAPEPSVAVEAGDAVSSRIRVFTPQSPLFAAASPQRESVNAGQPKATGGGAARTQATVATITTQPWTATVQASGDASRARSSRPEGAEAKADLARDLQRELKRVGCYEGDIDGSWGGGSRRAMSAFNERVNATLPVDEPDFILLTLLQGHRDKACGVGCSSGLALVDGRCQPKAQIAQGTTKKWQGEAMLPAAGAVVVVDQAARTLVRTPARSAEASIAKAPDARVAAVPEPRATKQPVPLTTAAIAASAVREPVRTAPPVTAPAPSVVAAAPVEPLPGRMTIGGPVPAAAVDRAPVGGSETAASIRHAPPPAPAVRRAAVEHAPRAAQPPSRVLRAPAPVAAPQPHRPRPTQYVAAGNSGSSASSRQRSMIYNLFQRPDRLSN